MREKKNRKRLSAKIWMLAVFIGMMPTYAVISNAEIGQSVKDDAAFRESGLDRDESTSLGDVVVDKEQQEGQEDAADREQEEGKDTAVGKEPGESKDDGQDEGTGERVEDGQENAGSDRDKGDQLAGPEDEGTDLDEDINSGDMMPDADPDEKDVPPATDDSREDDSPDTDKEDIPTDPDDETLLDGSKAPALEGDLLPEEDMVNKKDQTKDLPVIIAFDELEIKEYRFTEKPELEVLLERFPEWLDAIVQEEDIDPEQEENAGPEQEEDVSPEQEEDADPEQEEGADPEQDEKTVPEMKEDRNEDKASRKKVPTTKIPVRWGYDGVYDEDEKEEYVFFAILDEEDYVLQTEVIPSILVKVTRADQTILTDQIGDITVTVMADADVLPSDTTLQVEQIMDKERLTALERAIGEETRTMIGMRIHLYDSAGKVFHPELMEKEIHIRFEGLDGALGAKPEEVLFYSFGENAAEEVVKEDREYSENSIGCQVSRLDGIVGCVLAERGETAVEIRRDGEVVRSCASLAQAVGWAEDGDTLLLAADHIVEKDAAPIIIRREVTLDLNGYTLTLEKTIATNRNIVITGPDQEPGKILAINNRGILRYKKEELTLEDMDEDGEGAVAVESGLIIGHCAAWGTEG